MLKFYWSNQHTPSSYIPRYRVLHASSLPEQPEWIELVKKALFSIRKKKFQKVVLARRKTLVCDSIIDPFSLCAALQGKTVFLVQETSESTFLGASPETLYRREGTQIECDALAGTRPLGAHQELLASKKDRDEFLFVQHFLIKALTPLCHSPPSTTPITIRNAATTCHLYAKIFGILKETVSDEQILAALHPTPAVGGYPRVEALRFIASQEPFSRGLYSAPIGWFSKNRAEFAVGIRSAQIEGAKIHLYAGAGIIEGSDPLLEWEETECKLALWNQFFMKQSP